MPDLEPMSATVSNGPEVDVPRSEPLEPEPPAPDVAPGAPPPEPPAAFPVEAVQLGVAQLLATLDSSLLRTILVMCV